MTNGLRRSRRAVRIAEALIVLACFVAHCVLEVNTSPVKSTTRAVGYLSQFGYLPPVESNSRKIISQKAFSNAISQFQSFVGINVTGEYKRAKKLMNTHVHWTLDIGDKHQTGQLGWLACEKQTKNLGSVKLAVTDYDVSRKPLGNLDVKTAHMMSMPRCGVKDKIQVSKVGKGRSYTFFGSKWQVKSLTYKITKYPTKLKKKTVDREIHRAFNEWSKYTDLTFTPKNGKVDIVISFVTGEHGDGQPLDGPGADGGGNVLAHAFAPGSGIGGDAHFDNAEMWSVDTYDGTNLFQVAAHELGHSLGLDHSHIENALMAPIYRSYDPNFMLHKDDITGIQALYGPKTSNKRPKTSDKRPRRPNWFDQTRIFNRQRTYNHRDFYGRPGHFSWSGHF